ncbi:MAG TPA: hypothetical protein VFY45_21825, partial [Baekduia sp.]|nr:hypothetical protein [Baekduia sp.]
MLEVAGQAGHGVDVCEAYTKRLNRSEFQNFPFCGRPEDDSVAGFERLVREPLSEQELLKIGDQVDGFLLVGDPDYLSKRRAINDRVGRKTESNAP